MKREATVLETKVSRLGVRRLRLLEETVQHEAGSSFVFEVNNVAMCCGGANWIPDDSFLPRITRERYAQRLINARDANMTMIRVWGGGIYEDDAFYDLCDELGLLVWQDFMFACGIYPAHPSFLESVALEATANIQRLRHHACLAIWTGNNEDYQLAYSAGYYDPNAAPDASSSFPARVIYEELLPALLALRVVQRQECGQPVGGRRSRRSVARRPPHVGGLGTLGAAVPALQRTWRALCVRVRHAGRAVVGDAPILSRAARFAAVVGRL